MGADDEPAGVPAFLEFRIKTSRGDWMWRPDLTTADTLQHFEVADGNGMPILTVPLPIDEHTVDRCECRISRIDYSTVAIHFDQLRQQVHIITRTGSTTMTEDDWFAFVMNAATVRARARKAGR